MDGQMLALLGVAAIAGASQLARGSASRRYEVRRRRQGDYVIVDTVSGESSDTYGETWARKAQAEAVVRRLLAVIAQRTEVAA